MTFVKTETRKPEGLEISNHVSVRFVKYTLSHVHFGKDTRESLVIGNLNTSLTRRLASPSAQVEADYLIPWNIQEDLHFEKRQETLLLRYAR